MRVVKWSNSVARTWMDIQIYNKAENSLNLGLDVNSRPVTYDKVHSL